ncbi:MAG: DUF3332 family protein [Leptospiraceae bacterium]|nr:DUF3332 family protein [Leptospiraceae bacterium]
MKRITKKIILMLLVVGVSLSSFANCFGKFTLVKKMHGFNEGIDVGSGFVSKFIRTVVMWVAFIVAGWWLFALDLIVFNLIEFWTDSNPLGLNEYDKEGKYVKSFSRNGDTLKLTYLNFGQKLIIDLSNQEKSEQFVVLRSEKGKFFKETDNKLEEISIDSVNVGNKLILKMATGGKLESSKVMDLKEYQQLERKYAGEIY